MIVMDLVIMRRIIAQPSFGTKDRSSVTRR
jgi:hypothetical protein